MLTTAGTRAFGTRGPVAPLRSLALPIVMVGAASGLTAAVVAQTGIKGLLLAGGVWAMVIGVMAVRERSLLILTMLILATQVVMTKAIGSINPDVASGANAFYITSFDAILSLLYLMWLLKGTLVRDLRLAMRDRRVLLPLVAMAAVIPSFLAATDVHDAFAELFRMGWAYLLFVYLAVRLRTRRQIGYVIGSLFLIAVVQCALIIVQWKTGRALGLAFLGESQALATRTLDGSNVLRPSGTAIHPNILTPYLAPIGLLALSLAIEAKRAGGRLLLLAAMLLAFIPLAIAQTRAAIVATAVAVVFILVAAVLRGRLGWRWLLAGMTTAGFAALVFWPWVQSHLLENLGSQFQSEITLRLSMNGVAIDMFQSSPLVGVGLNNFMSAVGPHNLYSAIVFPVHNLYLLALAETGILGIAGLAIVAIGLTTVALRVAHARDPFLSALGVAVAATYLFFAVEEVLSFSLRIDMPLAIAAVFAGLCMAARRLQVGQAQNRPPARARG